MIYLIGGAPRTGKSILGQRLAAKLKIGWISTDLLADLLRLNKEEGAIVEWNAAPEAIAAAAEWFFPFLERFVWGVSSQAESYVIEGVGFLPAQVAALAASYPVRAVFLGSSSMTLERFDEFPDRSLGYAGLPEVLRRQIVQDVPLWSEFVRQEAERFGYPYMDMGGDFPSRLREAGAVLTAEAEQSNRSMPDVDVVPVLAYLDVRAAVDWLCRASGFAERLRIGDHRSQLRVGDGSVVVAARPAGTDAAPGPDAAMHSTMVRVSDVDAHHARARNAGARITSAPETYPYGERQYTAEDLGGHLWTFSQTVEDVDPAQWGGLLLE